MLAGVTLVTINPFLTATELKYALNRVDIKLIGCPSKIGTLDHYKVISEIVPDLQRPRFFGESVICATTVRLILKIVDPT